jgi:hypothetical protein
MLYSYNQQTPSFLPDRIRLSSGLTRTDSNTFTHKEILDAGYVAADNPPLYDPNQQHLVWDKTTWKLVDFTPEELAARLALEWKSVRNIRNKFILDVEWRVFRALSQQRMGLPVTDNIADLDTYIQALREVTDQPDPYTITWPVNPVN